MDKFWTIFKRVAVNLARWKCRVLAWCPSYDLLGRSDQQGASIVTVGERHWRLYREALCLYTSLDPRFKIVRHRCALSDVNDGSATASAAGNNWTDMKMCDIALILILLGSLSCVLTPLLIHIFCRPSECMLVFYVHISVHHKSMYLEDQRDAVLSSLYSFYCQVTLRVSGVSRTHHQEYTNCVYNYWCRSWIWRCKDKIRLKRVHGRAATSLGHGHIWPWPSDVAVLFNRILSLHLQINDLYH